MADNTVKIMMIKRVKKSYQITKLIMSGWLVYKNVYNNVSLGNFIATMFGGLIKPC